MVERHGQELTRLMQRRLLAEAEPLRFGQLLCAKMGARIVVMSLVRGPDHEKCNAPISPSSA